MYILQLICRHYPTLHDTQVDACETQAPDTQKLYVTTTIYLFRVTINLYYL